MVYMNILFIFRKSLLAYSEAIVSIWILFGGSLTRSRSFRGKADTHPAGRLVT